MLPFNALICLSHFNVFLQLALRGACWEILLQLKWDWKISSCSEWITVGNNLTHPAFVWGYCCLKALLLQALCNILWPPKLKLIDRFTSNLRLSLPWRCLLGVILIFRTITSNKQMQIWTRFAKVAFSTLCLRHVSLPSSPHSFASRSYSEESRQGEVQCAAGPAERMALLTSENFSLLKALVSVIPHLAAIQIWVKRHKHLPFSRDESWFLLSHLGHVIQVMVQYAIRIFSLLDILMLKIQFEMLNLIFCICFLLLAS